MQWKGQMDESPKLPIPLGYALPQTRSRLPQRDPAVTAAVCLGVLICVPFITGLLALAGGIAICRKPNVSPDDHRAGVAAVILGLINLALNTLFVLRVDGVF